jgi:hypothetical protein
MSEEPAIIPDPVVVPGQDPPAPQPGTDAPDPPAPPELEPAARRWRYPTPRRWAVPRLQSKGCRLATGPESDRLPLSASARSTEGGWRVNCRISNSPDHCNSP